MELKSRAEQRGGSESKEKEGLQSWATTLGRFQPLKGMCCMISSIQLLPRLNKAFYFTVRQRVKILLGRLLYMIMYMCNEKQVKETVPAWSSVGFSAASATRHMADNGRSEILRLL